MTMNTDEPQDQRAVDETAGGEIDLLVIGSDRQGHRPPRRWTFAALISGLAVVAVVALAGNLALTHGLSSPDARPTPSSATLPGSVGPGVPTSSTAMTKKQLEILALIESELPGELKVTGHHGIGESSIVAMAILDSQGYTWVDARVGTAGGYGWDPCRSEASCTIKRVKDGTLYSLQELETNGNRSHYSATSTYERSDGRYVYFNQSNVFDPDGRRSTMPLTDSQVRQMVTAPAWDALVADCQPAPGPNC